MNQCTRSIIVLLLLLSADVQAQSFIENKGQWPSEVLFRTELPQGLIYFEKDRITYDLLDPEEIHAHAHHHGTADEDPEPRHYHAYRSTFAGASQDVQVTADTRLKAYYNYFQGNDASTWAGKARSYRSVRYSDLYPGIDASYYFTKEGLLKYDLILKANADPSTIQIDYDGVIPSLNENGEMIIPTSVNTITEAKPYSYQIINGQKVEVDCSFVLEQSQVRFEVGDYDTNLELIIDPILKFSTFSGSMANNFGYTATFDQAGFLYSGSSAFGQGYPVSTGAYDVTFNDGNVDIALSKFDSTGTFLIWSTFIGGSGSELAHSIIVNEQDELFLFGTTGSDNYPTTNEAFDQSFAGGFGFNPSGLGVGFPAGLDIIVSKLSFDGAALLASTYVGSNGNDGLNQAGVTTYNYADEVRGEIDLDPEGNVLIASSTNNVGNPNNFPTTSGAVYEDFIGGNQDGVIFKMDPSLSELHWSTFFGGTSDDAALSITYNSNGDIIVCGGTNSTDLPTTPGALQSAYQGAPCDPWVVVLDSEGEEVLHCTYWGTNGYDQAYMVELDGQQNIHLFGQTVNGNFYIENAAFSNANSGQFVSKLTPELDDVVWSTAFGNGNGTPNISPTAFLVDLCDRIYLSGWGGPTGPNDLTTNGLPITPDAYQSTTDGGDFYLMAIADDASELVYGTFFGGDQSNEHVDGGTSRFDRKGKVYQAVCAGCQNNSDFPFFPNDALSDVNGSGGCNLGVFKMDFELPAVIADFLYTPICLPDEAVFTNTSVGGVTFEWNFGDGEGQDGPNASHLYDEPGLYTVTLILTDPMSCNLADTLSQEIFIFDSNGAALNDTTICAGEEVQLGFEPLTIPGISYSWTNADLLDDPDISNPVATVDQTTQFTLTLDNGICPSTATQTIFVQEIELTLPSDTVICDGNSVTLEAMTNAPVDFVWSSSPDFSDTLSTEATLTVTPLFPTAYYLSAEDECRSESSVDVGLFSSAIDLSENQFICAGDRVLIDLITSLDDDEYTVEWTPFLNIESGQGTTQVEALVTSDTWIVANIESIHGCVLQDSVLVQVSPLSFINVDLTGSPLLIPLGGNAQLNAEPSGYAYEWTPVTGLSSSTIPNPIASPPNTTTYTVTIIDDDINGDCAKSDTITVSVFEFQCAFPTIFLPNAFSPNQDGNNDILFVRGEYLDTFDLKIYDRWGELVFETQDKAVGWDGTFKGKRLDPAVYVYHLDMTCIDGQRNFEKGNITLIR